MIADGILVLNKPQNWTSHDCVAICRRVLRLKGVKKIGHGGTLDPMAEGVLPIFIGQATRIMEYLELDYKKYTCGMQLGIATDTQDIWGETLEQRAFDHITEGQVLRALDAFRGSIEQMPPMYSAVRIDGKHLYEYARKGRSDESELLDRIKPRRVHIRSLKLEEMDLAAGRLKFSVECSKGTYIRTICSDLGEALGCGGAMTSLVRTAIGGIDLSRSISPEVVKAIGEQTEENASLKTLEDLLLPPDAPLGAFGEIRMPADRARYFRQGNSIRLRQVQKCAQPLVQPDALTGETPCNARGRRYDRIYRVYQKENGLFLGTGFEDIENGVLKADKVFMALNEPKKKNESI